MSEGRGASAVASGLRRVRASVVGLLVLCAALIAVQGDAVGDGAPSAADRVLLAAALTLAMGSMLARQLAATRQVPLRARVVLMLVSYLLAGGIGLVGVAATRVEGSRSRGLLFVCAGAIFALRPSALRLDDPRV